MKKEEIVKWLETYAKTGKIPCKKALDIAREVDIPAKELGDILNELNIKVMGCQLNCFP